MSQKTPSAQSLELPKLSAFGIAYVLGSLLILVAITLVIWPTNVAVPVWARSMSDEIRFIAISAAGGAIGSALRTGFAIGKNTDLSVSVTGRVLQFVRLLIAVQMAALGYFAIRSFVLLPTTPVSELNPFGILFVGLLIGWAAEDLVPQFIARVKDELAPNSELESRIDLIASAVGAATLDNYRGRLCVEILDANRRPVFAPGWAAAEPDAGTIVLSPKETYILAAWFDPGASDARVSEEVSITGGNDVERISFVVAADSSASLRFTPGRNTFSFDPQGASERLEFEFVAPAREEPFALWLRATQKGRLTAVVSLDAMLG
jgi:hypothetical protein